MNQEKVVLKNDLAEIERLSDVVTALGTRHGLVADFLYAINLALDEILTNVISYGYDDEREHEILVRLAVQAGEFQVEVTDDGRPFNPLTAQTADLDSPLAERQIGGLGIHLTRTLMDALQYRRDDNKNVLLMSKRIPS